MGSRWRGLGNTDPKARSPADSGSSSSSLKTIRWTPKSWDIDTDIGVNVKICINICIYIHTHIHIDVDVDIQ